MKPCSELLTILGKIPPLGRFYRAPKKYRRTFWEEERQAQRARRQAKRTVCHGALARRGRDDKKEQSILPPVQNLPFYILHLPFKNEILRRFAPQDDRVESGLPSSVGFADTFPPRGRQVFEGASHKARPALSLTVYRKRAQEAIHFSKFSPGGAKFCPINTY